VLLLALLVVLPHAAAGGDPVSSRLTPRSSAPRSSAPTTSTPSDAGSPPTVRIDAVDHTDLPARAECLRRAAEGTGPLLLVVGASFTAGVGAGGPERAWSVDLTRLLGWRAVVAGIPGIGYVSRGSEDVGPLRRLLEALDPRRLSPALLIVQAGHDDIGVPPRLEEARAERLFSILHSELPTARLAALTVFEKDGSRSAAALATDRAIVEGVHHADPAAFVMDPLTGRWRFARAYRGLHPSARGAEQIATIVAARLAGQGVRPAGGAQGAALPVCDLTVPPTGHATG
jgi:lysophospholipase L1-like esterase